MGRILCVSNTSALSFLDSFTDRFTFLIFIYLFVCVFWRENLIKKNPRITGWSEQPFISFYAEMRKLDWIFKEWKYTVDGIHETK